MSVASLIIAMVDDIVETEIESLKDRVHRELVRRLVLAQELVRSPVEPPEPSKDSVTYRAVPKDEDESKKVS